MKKKITINIFCSTYGHNYFRLTPGGENTPELICKCCKGYFKFESNGSITSVTQKENEAYWPLVYQKKTA